MLTVGDAREGDDLHHAPAAVTAREQPASSFRHPVRRWLVFFGLAVVVLLADQAAKAWLVATVPPGGAIEVVGDWLRLIYGRNDGGLFGLFGGSAELLATLSLVVIGLIVVYHARSRPSTLLSIALGLLLGGALGNLIDRIRLGYVIDFVDAGIGSLRFYTFNVADGAISGAILLLILIALFPGLAGGTDAPDA